MGTADWTETGGGGRSWRVHRGEVHPAGSGARCRPGPAEDPPHREPSSRDKADPYDPPVDRDLQPWSAAIAALTMAGWGS